MDGTRLKAQHAMRACAVLLAGMVSACGPTGDTGTSTSSSGASGQASSSSGQASSSSSGQASSSSSGGQCPAIQCTLACEFGFAPDQNGCPTCRCLPDPRPCGQLDAAECRSTDRCALVTSGSGNTTTEQCCTRTAGGIDCTSPPRPTACMQDSECLPGQVCNTWDYCDAAPGCTDGQPCPAVCYGRCTAGGGGGCASDYECNVNERCEFVMPAPCDPSNGDCAVPPISGACVPVACPEIAVLCPDGNPPTGYVDVPHACPVPICGGDCTQLPPEQCEARRDCQAVYTGGECDCACDPNGECPPCACPSPAYSCQPRPTCVSDEQCGPGEYCDYSFDDCFDCGRPAIGLCVPRGDLCSGLDEMTCRATQGCEPLYGEQCPPCEPGTTCACAAGYVGCHSNNVEYCSQDRDCGPGFRCNLCPPFPGCPECDACGAPVCEPAPVENCRSDMECGPGRFCQFEYCTDSFPPSCVGSCVDNPVTCADLPEDRCVASPGCQPLYDTGCNDGCHDDQGRVTSCGPCLAIACMRGNFTGCEDRPRTCCSDYECAPGETCALGDNVGGLGTCVGGTEPVCGGTQNGICPSGSTCQVVGCADEPSPGSSSGGTGGGGSSPGCAAEFACVPVSGCSSDMECGPGMVCNSCPPDPSCPNCTVCGEPRCESAQPTCSADVACPQGCACRNGACVGPDDGECPVRPFRVCEDDSQCFDDEYCQRCPPGAACFAPDHCAPRELPPRACMADSNCLQDEHCENGVCVAGAPGLRECSSNLECRPDEYCQVCPPNALCLLPDHCAPRTFRVCERDEQCLPDEFCSMCPAGAQCLVADHCEVRQFRTCDADTDCNAGEHCEMCPPNALCFVADHCVPNQP